MLFEWDDEKALLNFRKHGVKFSEAVSVFMDSKGLEIFDCENSEHEERWVRLGRSNKSQLLVVVYCERPPDRIRIISTRAATKTERRHYIFRGTYEK